MHAENTLNFNQSYFGRFSAFFLGEAKTRRKFRRILTKMNLIDFLRFFLREAKKKLRCKIRSISIQMQIWIEILPILQHSFSESLFLFFTKFWMFLRSGSTFSAHYSVQKSDRFSKSLWNLHSQGYHPVWNPLCKRALKCYTRLLLINKTLLSHSTD